MVRPRSRLRRLRSSLLAALLAAACGDDGGGTSGGTTSGTTTGPGSTAAGSTSAATMGDSGSGSTTGTPSYSHAADIQPIWDANCVTGCHDSACATPGTCSPATQNLDLTLDGDGYDDLVDRMSVQFPAMVRVEPGDPENSYLWHKIAGTHEMVCMAGCGTQMPKNAMPLDEATQQKIYDWIAGGANP